MGTTPTLQAPQHIQNRFVVIVRRPFLRDLLAWFEATRSFGDSADLGKFINEIIEERLVHFRSLKIRPKGVMESLGEEKSQPTPKRNGGQHYDQRRKLSPEDKQVAIYLRGAEKLTIAAIADRLRCGRSTIRRALDAYDEHEFEAATCACSQASRGPREDK